MKRLGGVWERLSSFDNLYRAYRKARKGKAANQAVCEFALDLEQQLWNLHTELRNGAYRHGPYRQFEIYERKPRIISAATFRDRVVHHALMNVLEPWLDRRMIDHSYACRKNRGVHKAVDTYQKWSRRYAYVLKLDVRRYFPSIDHGILKRQLARRIKDTQTLALCCEVIDSGNQRAGTVTGKGLPIGNLTSQVFANVYLDEFDHWLYSQPECGAYLRYVDDLVILADNKAALWALLERIKARLQQLELELRDDHTMLTPCRQKLDLFGYQVSPQRRWLRNETGYRARRRLVSLCASYARGNTSLAEVRASVASWLGHLQHGEGRGLAASVLSPLRFQRSVS